MWSISKTFEFCYAHRVWTQVLDGRFATDTRCGCRHIHGHNGTITVGLAGDTLNQQSMIYDYKGLGWLKKLLDEQIDHKFIMDRKDPYLTQFLSPFKFRHEPVFLDVEIEGLKFAVPSLTELEGRSEPHEIEILSGLVLVDFVPTSEELARWVYGAVKKKMETIGVIVSGVSFTETEKTSATYYE